MQGKVGDVPVEVAPGTSARVRIINTDSGVMPVWVSGAAFELVAVDGTDVVQPTAVEGRKVLVAAGGRVDLQVARDALAVYDVDELGLDPGPALQAVPE